MSKAKKYYVVKVGHTTGIFDTWEECKASVDGYPGALYKSFQNITDAYAYMGWEGRQISFFDTAAPNDFHSKSIGNPTVNDIPHSTLTLAVAYVDGSFNAKTNIFGYGAVIFHNGEEIHLYNSYDDTSMASMRNVAGEIYGAMAAMDYAITHNVKNLTIYYDYMGIAKWCTGEWKTNKEGTLAYKRYYEKAKKKLNIKFEKVKGHSGDKYNDLADKLAKKACGVE